MDEPDVWVGVPLRGKDNPHGGSDTERYRWHRHDHVKLSDIGVSIEHHPACRSCGSPNRMRTSFHHWSPADHDVG
jgi:hypothetical protein